jgi:hypothetical protein
MRSALRFILFVAVMVAPAWGSGPIPLWKTDVRQFGYESFPRKMVRAIGLSVAFIDNSHLAIAWIDPDRTKNNKHREPRLGDAAHARVVVVDASTGRKEVEKEWPTQFAYRSPVLASLSDGTFMVCTDDALRIVSATLNLVKEQELPSRSECIPSPSGRTLLIITLSEHSAQLKLMHTQTFEIVSSWTEQLAAGAMSVSETKISDHWLLGYCGTPIEICVRRIDEGWHPLRVTGIQTSVTDKRRRISASFISDEVLAIRDKVTTLATVNGSMLFQISTVDKHLFGSSPVSSSNGERFVLAEGRLRGIESEPLDMYPFYADDRATVYDIRDRHSDLSLKLRGTSPWTPWHTIFNVLALSPDGSSLALISDGVLEVFAIPARNAEK